MHPLNLSYLFIRFATHALPDIGNPGIEIRFRPRDAAWLGHRQR